MPNPLIGVLGASAGGAVLQAKAAGDAASAQKSAAKDQLALQERMYEEGTERLQPWVGAGKGALGAQNYLLGLGRAPVISERKDGTKNRYSFEGSPSYQFNLNEGLGAVQAGAAARGGLYSGAAMQALQERGSGIASNEFWNNYNALAGLSTQGQNAATGQVQAGQNYAQGGSNALANYGNAGAAGAIGTGNAISGGIQNAIGGWGYLNQMKDPGTTGSSFGGGSLFGGL